jgi:hypothetical protein
VVVRNVRSPPGRSRCRRVVFEEKLDDEIGECLEERSQLAPTKDEEAEWCHGEQAAVRTCHRLAVHRDDQLSRRQCEPAAGRYVNDIDQSRDDVELSPV